jgi:hypothetical protein
MLRWRPLLLLLEGPRHLLLHCRLLLGFTKPQP